MFQRISKLFIKKPSPQGQFVDEMFGEFIFDPAIGWKGSIVLAEAKVELVFGSDGGTFKRFIINGEGLGKRMALAASTDN